MSRIEAIRLYLIDVLDGLLKDNDYQVNVNFLEKDSFSIDRLLIENDKKWITPIKKHREVYELRSSKPYSSDVMTNLKNIGFFEDFEEKISINNELKILPNIDGITSIKCLNVGGMALAEPHQAIFTIQIQITYIGLLKEIEKSI